MAAKKTNTTTRSRQAKSQSPRAVRKVSKATKAQKVKKVQTSKKVSKAKSTVAKTKKTATSKLTAELYNISGKKEGQLALPQDIFGSKVNKQLLSQAIRVYESAKSAHYGSTKTRSEIRGGGAKPWRQKGTGRARAGSRRSPLWVGGAKALGPKPRKTLLDLPKKMKKAALISALSTKAQDNGIKIVSNFEKIDPKTKTVAIFLQKLETKGKTLFVVSASNQNINLATRNIREISLSTTQNLNTLEVIRNRNLIFSKEAMDTLRTRFEKSQQNK